MNNKKRCIIICVNIILLIALYLMYIIYYYKEITINSFIVHTVTTTNIILNYIRIIAEIILNSIINENTMKIFFIGIFVIYSLKNLDLLGFINNIKTLQLKDFKLELNKQDAEATKREEEDKIKNLKKNEENLSPTDIKKIQDAEERAKIIQILIDTPYISNLINMFVNQGKNNVIVPLNLIPDKVNLKDLSEIFEYKLQPNSVKLIKLKVDIQPTIIDVFNQLLKKGIIYPK
ncbi:MAG: hypothetical protein AB2417_01605 [Clostridiaceae bacterium]